LAKIGYIRVSTAVQNLQLQRDAMKAAGVGEIYEERRSGADVTRYNLNACLKALKEGDTLVVWRLDRLGRSLPHLVEIINGLRTRGVGFQSLTENIDTTTANGQLMFHIIAAFAEFERNLISERVKAGLDSLREAEPDRVFGRPPKVTPVKREALWSMFEQGKTTSYIAQALELGETTVKRAIREGKAKLAERAAREQDQEVGGEGAFRGP
jgi:DNA invertase Pin-like site-specific DNA recombinase